MLAVLIASVAVVVATPGAEARRPWRGYVPTSSYAPRHVWQSKANCIFAAGAMLIDKWTAGRTRVTQGRLRKASGDKEGGADLRALYRGAARTTGIRLRFSPGYGDPMTWWQLLDRLENGGGAVLVGAYGRLPAQFSRWDRRFARSSNDSHAVYVQQYDRARGRVWLMDPLAGGGFPGEWIDVEALHRFADIEHGLVVAAATPARRRPSTAPLIDHAYRLGRITWGRSLVAGASVPLQVPLTIADGFPRPGRHRIVAQWIPLDPSTARATSTSTTDPGATASSGRERASGVAAPAPSTPAALITAGPIVTPGGDAVAGSLPVPTVPGRYRLSVSLVPASRSAGRAARRLPPVEVTVLPPFTAAVKVPPTIRTAAGQSTVVAVTVANPGALDWGALPSAAGSVVRPKGTHDPAAVLVGSWRGPRGEEIAAGQVAVELGPGERTVAELAVQAPAAPGSWVLELDIVTAAYGSLAATGAKLPVVVVRVLAAHPGASH